MNKLYLLKQAEHLYCVENFNADKISEKLNISRRTVFNWIKKYNWKNISVKIKDIPKQFSGEIYSLGTKLSRKMIKDLENNRNIDKHTVRAIEEIIKIINRFEKEKHSVQNNSFRKFQPEQPFTPEFINKINKDILGWSGNF